METLKLEHIAPYPKGKNGIQFQYKGLDWMRFKKKHGSRPTLGVSWEKYDNAKKRFMINKIGWLQRITYRVAHTIIHVGTSSQKSFTEHELGKNVKPIFYPLSDLTKPIWNNTEEFVPLEKFYEILDCRTAINENDVRIDIDTIIKHGIEMDTDWIYVKKFFEWKFVVDIPEHLWIDINTLEENPYK